MCIRIAAVSTKRRIKKTNSDELISLFSQVSVAMITSDKVDLYYFPFEHYFRACVRSCVRARVCVCVCYKCNVMHWNLDR